jgi:hypothetical protein
MLSALPAASRRSRGSAASGRHPSAADNSPNRVLDGMKRRVDGSLSRRVSPNDDDAWQAPENDLD